MAEPAIAVAAAEATEEAPATGGELRDKLIATAKELSAAKENRGKPDDKSEKPKSDPKKPEEAKAKLDDKKPEPKPEEEGEAEIRAKRKALSKFSRKLETREVTLNTREEQLKTHESRAQHEHNVFIKDPIAWLRSRGVNVRNVLLDHAREDAEDPKEKELKTLKERTEILDKKIAEREKAEAAEKAAKEAAEREGSANKQIEATLGQRYAEADGADYPLLSTLSTPDKVAFYGRQVMVDHYRKTGEELAPAEVFAILEAEVRAHEARTKAIGKKPEPPDRVRAAKSANPETSRETRSARDVTNRTARVRTTADDAVPTGKSGVDRDQLRKNLIGIAREHVR